MLSIIRRRFFINGNPVQSTLAISSGDFKICGVVMGMSILQGGPAPNFMAANITSYITGSKLSPNENKDIKYKAITDSVSDFHKEHNRKLLKVKLDIQVKR